MSNRTLQFFGKAYGTEPVRIIAHINNQLVFDGTVNTVDAPINVEDTESVLFSVGPSPLFPVDFEGTVPMTVSVELGDVVLGEVYSNLMRGVVITGATKITGAVNGRALTTSLVESGTVAEYCALSGDPVDATALSPNMPNSGQISQLMVVAGGGTSGQVGKNTYVESGSGNTWILAENLIPLPQGSVNLVGIAWEENQGNANIYQRAYTGVPANADSTKDPRTSVVIDGVAKTPERPPSNTGGTWRWVVKDGSMLTCNLTVSKGNLVG